MELSNLIKLCSSNSKNNSEKFNSTSSLQSFPSAQCLWHSLPQKNTMQNLYHSIKVIRPLPTHPTNVNLYKLNLHTLMNTLAGQYFRNWDILEKCYILHFAPILFMWYNRSFTYALTRLDIPLLAWIVFGRGYSSIVACHTARGRRTDTEIWSNSQSFAFLGFLATLLPNSRSFTLLTSQDVEINLIEIDFIEFISFHFS